MKASINQLGIQKRFLPLLESQGLLYKKYREVIAKLALGGELIESITASGKETENTAKEGDYLVQNQTSAREWYIVPAEKFTSHYEFSEELKDGLARYKPKGQVIAVKLTSKLLNELQLPDTFHFQAPWGEAEVAHKGDFMVTPPDFSEVYRIAAKEFKETYRRVQDTGL